MRHDSESGSEIKLLSCSGCRMIAYCGLAHQKEHWAQHKVLYIFSRMQFSEVIIWFHFLVFRICAKSYNKFYVKRADQAYSMEWKSLI
jgi:hypothetical protein